MERGLKIPIRGRIPGYSTKPYTVPWVVVCWPASFIPVNMLPPTHA